MSFLLVFQGDDCLFLMIVYVELRNGLTVGMLLNL